MLHEYRRMGFGSRLFAETHKALADKGCKFILARTKEAHDSVFLMSQGYRPYERVFIRELTNG